MGRRHVGNQGSNTQRQTFRLLKQTNKTRQKNYDIEEGGKRVKKSPFKKRQALEAHLKNHTMLLQVVSVILAS